jgi:hypothetical protein
MTIEIFITKLLCPECDEICILQKSTNMFGAMYRIKCSNCDEKDYPEWDKKLVFQRWSKNYRTHKQKEKERKELNRIRYGVENPYCYPFFGDTTDYGE